MYRQPANFNCGSYRITRQTVRESFDGTTRLQLRSRNFHFIDADVFQEFAHFTEIDVTNNSINSLPANLFDHSFSLVRLLLDFNSIATIDGEEFAKASQLRELSLSHNMIVSIGDLYIRSQSLTYLNLSNNFIETVNGLAFASLEQLVTLNLSNNKIYQIIGSAFYGNKKLKYLFLENNNLTNLHECTFGAQKSLEILNLCNNQLTMLRNQLFVNKSQMITLNVLDNPIVYLDNLRLKLPEHLVHLELSINCHVTFVEFAPLVNLETFKLVSQAPHPLNFRHELEIGGFPQKVHLKHFHLSADCVHFEPELIINLAPSLVSFHFECTTPNGSNESKLNFYRQIDSWPHLRKFALLNFPQLELYRFTYRTSKNRDQVFGLEQLNLRGVIIPKKMVTIDEKLEKLLDLNLAFCRLDFDTMTGLIFLRHLQYLNMQSVPIRELAHDLFKYNEKLRSINFEQCSITKIEDHTFFDLGRTLEYLNLRRNLLKVITRKMFSGLDRKRTKISFEFNPACNNGRVEL